MQILRKLFFFNNSLILVYAVCFGFIECLVEVILVTCNMSTCDDVAAIANEIRESQKDLQETIYL